MNITNNAPTYSDAELDQAFMDEIKNGFQLEKQTEASRVDQARKEATQERGKVHPVLGRCVATIPHREYFRLIKKYGQDTVHSKEFLQYFQKNFSDLTPNKL
jgi:hypothetical protein|tara:strand:- start:736 stop:1041 length:306 start_codon:yes stop_codon:yes gene_type:complete